MKRVLALIFAVAVAGMSHAGAQTDTAPPDTGPPSTTAPSVPVLAHYYIWFNPTSWNRAKVDSPVLGHYSSDEATVMRTHIRAAKAAGIAGFIVSWKHTEELDRRLDQLVQIASEEHFALAITYQALDFDRNPLPSDQVAAGLDVFLQRWAANPVFGLFGKPVVIWTGTDRYQLTDLQAVTSPRRDRLTILASQKSVRDYELVAGAFDGDAYYWSSVDPATQKGYSDKLRAMGDTVHSHGGLWWAPAAPGFDARLLGGSRTVERKNGATFRAELDAAAASSPNAIAVISWNEFSENTYIEPSRHYHDEALRVLRDSRGVKGPGAVDFDSDGPAKGGWSWAAVPALLGLFVVVGCSLFVLNRRQRAHTSESDDDAVVEQSGEDADGRRVLGDQSTPLVEGPLAGDAE